VSKVTLLVQYAYTFKLVELPADEAAATGRDCWLKMVEIESPWSPLILRFPRRTTGVFISSWFLNSLLFAAVLQGLCLFEVIGPRSRFEAQLKRFLLVPKRF